MKNTKQRSLFQQSKAWLALVVAILATVAGGALYGRFAQRWGPPPDLVSAARQLDEMPRQLGKWTLVEEQSMKESVVEMLQCAGHVYRHYMHQDTGEIVRMVIIVGPSGPTAVHTPEICFSSRDYEMAGEREQVELSAKSGQDHSFWQRDFSPRNALAESLRVHYAWSLGDVWQASEAPRYQFAASPLLYKIQLAASRSPTASDDTPDAGYQFLKAMEESDWELLEY